MTLVQQVEPLKENGWLAHSDAAGGPGPPLVVEVCGRSVQAFAGAAPSIVGLQAALQKELSLGGQTFDVFDDCGTSLTTDGDLRSVIERGGQLSANLSEASVHYIENRREELSQLQWKVLRDKVASVAEKLVQVGHRVHEMSEELATFKHEHEESTRRMRQDAETLFDKCQESCKRDCQQLGERVDLVSNSVSSERSRREVAKQNTEQQIQGLRDMLLADRSTRRTEMGATNTMLEEGRLALLEEAKKKEAIEARHTTDVNWLSERIEAVALSQGEQVQDLCDQLKAVAFNVNASLQDGTRSVLQVQSIAENTQIEASSRIKIIEDRISGFECKVVDIGNREVLHYDDLLAKHRKTYAILEDVRLEERGKGIAMRRLQEEAEEMRKASPNSTILSTATQSPNMTLQVEADYSGLPVAFMGTAPAAGSFGSMPQPSPEYSRGTAARSVSPPMTLRSTPMAAPQVVVSSIATGTGSIPVAFRPLPGRGAALGAPVQPPALGLAPRSVSPPPGPRLHGFTAVSGPPALGLPAWAVQQQGRLSVPRQRPGQPQR